MNHMHFENRRRSRQFFWFVWALYVLVAMTKTFFTAAMAQIVFEGVMTKSQVGFIVAAFYLVYAPFQILGGIFADKYDPEKLISIGLFGGAIANVILFFNQNYYVVLFTWIFNAVIQFAIWPSVFKIISSQIVRSDSKNAAYYMSFSTSAGMILSYAIAAIMPKWYINFAVSAVVLFALGVILNLLTHIEKPYMFPDKPQEIPITGKSEEVNVSTLKLFKESGFFLMVLTYFLFYTVAHSVKTLSATMLMETYKNVTSSIGNVLNILVIAVSVGSLFLAKMFYYPKTVKSAPTGILIMLILALAAAASLLAGNSYITFVVITLCVVSGASAVVGLLMSYCNLRFAKFGKSATAAGIYNMAASLAVVMSSYGITKVADRSENWNTVLWIYFALIAVSVLTAALFITHLKNINKKYLQKHKQP
ncbi:MAG: MFS transporter, partial [Clostridia bacterium]|nr:MFS transporter [Clostridia bacterium]